jgi:protein TonB
MTSMQFKSKSLLFLFSFIAVFAFVSCNNGSDEKAGSTPAGTDTTATAATAADTSAAKTVKKTRKGKASAMMTAADNKMKIEKDKDGIYTNAEHMPQYPGGDAALSKFVEETINYPQDAMDANTEGTVRVSFVVDEKGMVTNPVVTGKSTNANLDAEATRVVKQMPAWKPGMVKGKSVKTRLELPITFKLADS